MNRAQIVTGIIVALAAGLSPHDVAAQPPSWGGSARCEVRTTGPGYVDQHTHTWTLTGGPPEAQGAFLRYPATWSVTGGGSLQRTQGSQTLTAQWTRSVPAMDGRVSFVVRASDGRLLIRAGHAQLRAPGAVAGTQTVTDGSRPVSSGALALEAFEWQFPAVEDQALAPGVTGSSTGPVAGSFGPMQPAGSQTVATCVWSFARSGPAAALPPGTLPPLTALTPPGTATTPVSPGTTVPVTPAPVATATPAPAAVPAAPGPATGAEPAQPTATVIPFIPPVDAAPPAPTVSAVPFIPPLATVPPPATPPGVSATPAPGLLPLPKATSGTYRLGFTRFHVVQEYIDDALDRDGKANEVYLAATMRVADRRVLTANGTVTAPMSSPLTFRSQTFGDTSRFPARVKAGTGSATGGLRTTDVVTFPQPLLVWQGNLADGVDVLILQPAVWDDDAISGEREFPSWAAGYDALVGVSPQTLQMEIAEPTVRPLTAAAAYKPRVSGLPAFSSPDANSVWRNDRPLGVERAADGFKPAPHYRGTYLILTREKIEAFLGASSSRTIAITIADDPTGQPNYNGVYTVTLHIARGSS
jgi:hypothetical protein